MKRLLDHPVTPYLFIALAVLFWSGNAVVGRGSVGLVPPIALSFWRWTGALLIMLPIAGPDLIRSWPVLRQNLGWTLVLSLLGVVFFNTLLYLGLQHTQAVNASLLTAGLPAMVIGLSWLVYRVRVTGRQGIGIFLSIVGVSIVVLRGDVGQLATLSLNKGDVIILVAVLDWAIYSMLLQRYRPLGLSGPVFLLATIILAVPIIGLLYLWELSTGPQIVMTWQSFAAIGYAAVFPSVLSYLFYNQGLRMTDANAAGVMLNVNPVFAVILAIIFLGEELFLFHGIGIVVIFSGLWMALRKGKAKN
ncbi:MAG: DMT family transporter [Magnetospiraceae bacterium]